METPEDVTPQCLRIILIAFNLAFIIAGVALVALGIFYGLNYNYYNHAIPEDYSLIKTSPWAAVGFGSALILISILGCCGAVDLNELSLTIYSALVMTIFLFQFGIGIYFLIKVYNNKEDLKEKIVQKLEPIFNEYNEQDKARDIINFIQTKAECCGLTGPSWWPVRMQPTSCYKERYKTININNKEGNTTTQQPNIEMYHSTPCPNALSDNIVANTSTISYLLLGICGLEFIGGILAICVTKYAREQSEDESESSIDSDVEVEVFIV